LLADIEIRALVRLGRVDAALRLLKNRGYSEEDAAKIVEELLAKYSEQESRPSAAEATYLHSVARKYSIVLAKTVKVRKINYAPKKLDIAFTAKSTITRYLAPANILFIVLLSKFSVDEVREIMYNLTYRVIKSEGYRVLRDFFIPIDPNPAGKDPDRWYKQIFELIAPHLKWALAELGAIEKFDEVMKMLMSMKPVSIRIEGESLWQMY